MKKRSKRKLSGMPPSTISYKRLICPYMETRVKMRKRVMAREAGGKRGRRQPCGDGAACPPAGIRPRSAEMRTASRRLLTPILRNTDLRRYFTVSGDMPIRREIYLFE